MTNSVLKISHVQVNGIRMRIAEQGEGPLVLLLHGFPETWYSWRHQLQALADAGYRAVAPDLRGFGGTAAPAEIDAYDILDLSGDIQGLVDHLGEKKAVLVGHDWGGVVAWGCSLLDPERYTAFVSIGVLLAPAPDQPPIELTRAAFGDNFHYTLYFQEPGVAEAELDADPEGFLKRVLVSPDTPLDPPLISDPKASAGGVIGRQGMPRELPPWLSQKDLDHYVVEFTGTGFRGGLNYYRNFDRTWEIIHKAKLTTITVPVFFIGGEKDEALGGQDAAAIESLARLAASDVRGVHLLANAGHFVQQERATDVNALLIDFLKSID